MITYSEFNNCWIDDSYFGTFYEFISKLPEHDDQSFENERDF